MERIKELNGEIEDLTTRLMGKMFEREDHFRALNLEEGIYVNELALDKIEELESIEDRMVGKYGKTVED